MKWVVKILGGILFGFLIVLLCALYLGGLIGCVYGIAWTWWIAPNHNTETKLLVTSVCVIGFFFTLTLIYFTLDDLVNPTRGGWRLTSKPITPTKFLRTEKKPILGDGTSNRMLADSESERG